MMFFSPETSSDTILSGRDQSRPYEIADVDGENSSSRLACSSIRMKHPQK
jgi:hypothetical protein